MLIKKPQAAVNKKKSSTNKSSIIQLVNSLTEPNIHVFRNTNFDNMAVELLTSGHRQSFELLEDVVHRAQKLHNDNDLIADVARLQVLRNYFTQAENYCRDGRFNQVSIAYCEAAQCETFDGMFWLQELIMERALEAAKRYKADGGRQLAYCQLQLAQMLEAAKVRSLRRQNIIYGGDYFVEPPARCIELLEACLAASLGRSQWLSNLVPYEYLCAGHLARVSLASAATCEKNLNRVIKLAEQAGCVWLECLSNYYLGKLLLESGQNRETEATVRLERGLEVLRNVDSATAPSNVWSDSETCMQAPSLDRLAGMCSCKLAKLKLSLATQSGAEQAKALLEGFLSTWSEISDERAEAYILLGELYDRHFYQPEKAVEAYNEAYTIRPTSDCTRVAIGIANSHLLLDGVMRLLDQAGDSDEETNACAGAARTSKRLLIWKDQPDDFEHDLESD